jgi:peptide/nickel transport system substrate-binding protein
LARNLGETITMALHQEPELLNPYIASQTASGEVSILAVEGLLTVNEKGEYVPQLANEVPSRANGGVWQDGGALDPQGLDE